MNELDDLLRVTLSQDPKPNILNGGAQNSHKFEERPFHILVTEVVQVTGGNEGVGLTTEKQEENESLCL